MNLIKCDSCGNRYIMCFHCVHNKYYRKLADWSHDEYIKQQAIKEFAIWCYVNGIDFGYMAKGTDTESVIVKVIKKYNADMRGEKND